MTADTRSDAAAQRHRAVFESAVDFAIVTTDRDGVVTDWNPGAERILGWTHDEIVGRSASCFFTPEDRDAGRAETEMLEALRHGRAADERWHLRKDGSRFWSGGELLPLRAPDGGHIGFLKILRDRTGKRALRERLDADQRLADAALKREAHWRGIFENLDEGFVLGELVRDETGRAVDWRYLELNRAWGRLVGIEPAAALGRTVREVLPGIGEDWITEFAAVAESGRGVPFTRYVAPLDQWYEGRCLPMGPDRFAAMFSNVTERRRDERLRTALLELGDRLRAASNHQEMARRAAALLGETLGASRAGYAIVENAECLVVEADWTAPGVASIAGRHWLRDYGSYGDALRRGELVAIDDVALDPRTGANRAAFAAVGVRSLLNLPIHENGRFVALLLLNGAQPRQWQPFEIAFMREVADRARQAVERCRAEDTLRALNASLERVVEDRTRERDRLWATSEDLLLLADADGRMLRASPSWRALLGHPDTALRNAPYPSLLHPDDLALAEANLRGMAATGRPVRQECRMRTADGGWKWIAWRFSPDPGAGRLHGIGRDVTAEREQADAQARLEAQLRQSQKMEAVGQLTGGIAHDFNNLLTGITGSLELLQTRLAQGRLKDLERYIAASQGAAKRAAALTHRLLAFSRQQTLDPRPANVDRLVAGMEELIRRTMGPAVRVEVAPSEGLWTTMIDPHQLENALLNLCINARDAMPQGGRLTIETCNLSLDERGAPMRGMPAGQYISLCVSDSGAGMTAEVAARAFDPFFTTKPLGQGTGLGLSMIYGFVRQSGGQVRLYSEPGDGTMACLYLPRHFGPEEGPAPPAGGTEMPRAERGQQVLVVDDEPVVRMLVTEVLEELGYGAIEAADGASGLALLQSDARIDLLVTDVGLPGGMNGRQMADQGRLARPGLTVLFITGFAENAVVSHGHLDKDMHVITKPFALETLATRIRDLIGGQGRPA